MRFLLTAMALPFSVDVPDAGTAAAAPGGEQVREAVARAFAVIRAAERRFSRHLPDSELSRLDRAELRLHDASPELLEVLTVAETFGQASGGAFGVERPDGHLDLDGVVKGWAAQRAADALAAAGVERFCLNAGGDVVVQGGRAPGVPWQVGVRSPWSTAETLVVLPVHDGAVATSGTYERGAHVRDARTGAPATALVSATVVADDLVTADVAATTVVALGEDGVAWAQDELGCGVLAVRADGTVVRSGLGLSRPA